MASCKPCWSLVKCPRAQAMVFAVHRHRVEIWWSLKQDAASQPTNWEWRISVEIIYQANAGVYLLQFLVRTHFTENVLRLVKAKNVWSGEQPPGFRSIFVAQDLSLLWVPWFPCALHLRLTGELQAADDQVVPCWGEGPFSKTTTPAKKSILLLTRFFVSLVVNDCCGTLWNAVQRSTHAILILYVAIAVHTRMGGTRSWHIAYACVHKWVYSVWGSHMHIWRACFLHTHMYTCMYIYIWYMIYDIWYTTYDIWHMIYDIWCMVYYIWYIYIHIYIYWYIYI